METEPNQPQPLSDQRLHAREKRSRALLDTLPDLLFVLSRDGVYLDCHAANPDLLPMPPEHLLGKTVRDVMPRRIAEWLEASLARVLQTGQVEILEYPLTVAAETRYYESRVTACGSERALVIVSDITARKKVEAELRDQVQLFENLVAVARAMAERPTLPATLQNALEIAMALTGATGGVLNLLNGLGDITYSVLSSGPAATQEREPHVASITDTGLAGWVARHRQAVLIEDILTDERRLTLPDTRYHFRSALCVPILNESTLVGILTVTHPQSAHFHQRYLRLIKAAAGEIALAVRNAQIFEAQRRMAERQITLYEVLRAVSGLQDPNKVARLAVDAIAQFAGWPQAAIIVPSEDSTQWVVSAASGYLTPVVGLTCPIEQGIVGRALRTGRMQNVPDVSADPDYVAGHPHTRSELIVQLRRGQAMSGVLSLDSDRVAGFDSDDVLLAESLADAIALALDNARLYAQTQRHAADMGSLYAITRTTSRSLAVEEVLEQALSSAISLLAFSAGLIALVESDDSIQSEQQQGDLRLVAARGLPTDLVEHFRRDGLQDTLTAYVHQRQESLVIEDSQRGMSPEIKQVAEHLLDYGYRAYAGIPLLHQGQSLGVMSLVAREPRSSSTYDVAMLGTIGQQIASAVANARLFQATLIGHSRSQALIRSSRDGIILIGMNGRILILNPPTLKLLRLPGLPQEWLGRKLGEALAVLRVFAPTALRAVLAERRRIRHENKSSGEGEIEVPPHTAHWVRLPVTTGAVTQGQLIMLYDVTAERAAERLREDMTHTMVHDLRNPLSSISAALEMVTEGMLGDVPLDQLDVLRVALNSTHRMLELVNAILDVSRLESGRMPLEQRAFDLAALIAESLQAQSALAGEKNIRLEARISADLPQAWADAKIIARVLQNLIGNAVKFTPAEGRVSVAAQPDDETPSKVIVRVSDTGPGIPPEIQFRLFQKFVSGRQPGRGSGLGLVFCKLALEAHGERIWADSAPGQGTTFSFSLAACR